MVLKVQISTKVMEIIIDRQGGGGKGSKTGYGLGFIEELQVFELMKENGLLEQGFLTFLCNGHSVSLESKTSSYFKILEVKYLDHRGNQ